jgi:hypothetical protein
MWEAHTTLVPDFTKSDRLALFAARVALAIFHETSDSGKSQRRLVFFRSTQLPCNVLHHHQWCAAHIIHLILTLAVPLIAEENVIGDVYAFAFIATIAAHHQTLIANLRRLIHKTLEVIDNGTAPLEEHLQQVRDILDSTVKRRFSSGRGSNIDAFGEVGSILKPGDAELYSLCQMVRTLFNGDTRLPYPVHVVTARTRGLSRYELADMMTDVYLRVGFLSGAHSSLPAKNKWGTMFDCLEGQSGGFLLHNLNGQVAVNSFSSWADGRVEGGDNDEDTKIAIQKKGWRTKCYAGDPARRKRACLTLFSCTPLDFLWRHLQHSEVRGGALQDLCHHRSNGFIKAGRQFMRMVSGDCMTGSFAPYFCHFGRPGTESHDGLIEEVRHVTLHQAAHTWFRLHVPSLQWPLKFLGMVDARFSPQEQRAVAEAAHTDHRCCQDPPFTLKVSRCWSGLRDSFGLPPELCN